MKHKFSVAGFVCGASFALSSQAAELPKVGDFKLHSGYYFSGTVTPVGKNRVYAQGPYWGVSFNDAGSGVFHHAAWNCPGLAEMIDGKGNPSGHCSISDANGVAYIEWASSGTNESFGGKATFTGGAGKYEGISGAFNFSCRLIHENGRQHMCNQMGSYKLP